VANLDTLASSGSLAAFPTGGVNQQINVDESTPLVLTSIGIGDTDAGTDPLTLSLSVTNGTLAIFSFTGLTFTDLLGSDGTMAFSGSLTALNAALVGLTYTPDTGFNGMETLTLTVDDGQGGVTTETLDIAVNDNGVDETNQVGTAVADVLNGTVFADTLT
ncbi:unnamed protein product, partial [Laminaria digitata]